MASGNRPKWNYPKWAALRLAVYVRDAFTCRRCGWTPGVPEVGYTGRRNLPWVDGRELQVDHILPVAAGGEHTLVDNLQALCSHCNYRKSART